MGKSEQGSDGVPGISPDTEASKLLEAALMQMDGIISGNSGSLTAHSPDYGFVSSPPGVREAANSLVSALQNCPAPPPPDPAVLQIIWDWIQPQEQDERYRKLQSERDNLQLQVQVLSEQIEAQTDKIADLEKSLSEKKQQLINTEDMLQREMLSRSSLETQKLELMSAMSELKLQHAELERELVHLRSSQFNNNSSFDSTKKSQYLPRISPQPHHTSTPVHHLSSQNIRVSPSPSPLSGSLSASPRKIDSSSMQQDVQPPKTPPATYRRQIDLQYSSLPRQQFLSNGGTLGVVDSNANPADGARKGVAFGRGLSSLLGGRARGHSVPNLGDSSCPAACKLQQY